MASMYCLYTYLLSRKVDLLDLTLVCEDDSKHSYRLRDTFPQRINKLKWVELVPLVLPSDKLNTLFKMMHPLQTQTFCHLSASMHMLLKLFWDFISTGNKIIYLWQYR